MSDRIEAEILDALGEEVAASVDTPLVVIEGPKGDTGVGVSPGGAAGQMLVKKSGADYDTEWRTPVDPKQIGDLAGLTTEAKDTLVAAINEVALMGGRMSLRVADGYIQYSTDGGMTWTNLIAMADLKGANGDTGATGPAGAPGKPGEKGADGSPGIYYGTTQPTGDTHPVWIDPDGGPDDGGLLPAVTDADNGKVLRVVSGA